MEKRLYFCDICGDEIKENESCHRMTIESVTVKKRVWDNEGYTLDDNKDWHTILVCDKCYDREKDKSLVIPYYERVRDEWNRRLEKEREDLKMREVPYNG